MRAPSKLLLNLCASLPGLRDSLLAAADKKSNWRIVRWEGKSPSVTALGDLIDVPKTEFDEDWCPGKNEFSCLTSALFTSESVARSRFGDQNITQRGHSGVWRCTDGGRVIFQTVMPNLPARQLTPDLSSPEARAPATPLVRIGEAEFRLLRQLSERQGKTMQSIVEAAIREYDRADFFKRADEAYRALRADPEAWAAELAERAEWDGVLMDDIDPDEKWTEDGRLITTVKKELAIA